MSQPNRENELKNFPRNWPNAHSVQRFGDFKPVERGVFIMRDSVIIYRSFYESIKSLPKTKQAEVWEAIFEYSLNFKEIKLEGLSFSIFTLIKPLLSANNAKYKNGVEHGPKGGQYGVLGGRPLKNNPHITLTKPSNVDDNVDDNEKEEENENVEYSEASSDFAEDVEILETKKETPLKNSAKPPSTEYAKCMDVYNEWHKIQVGVPAKINVLEGSKMKTIITYMRTISPDNPTDKTLEYILSHWKRLEDFYQKQVKLSQIDSNLPNIIAAIKNSRTNKNQSFIESQLEKLRT